MIAVYWWRAISTAIRRRYSLLCIKSDESTATKLKLKDCSQSLSVRQRDDSRKTDPRALVGHFRFIAKLIENHKGGGRLTVMCQTAECAPNP